MAYMQQESDIYSRENPNPPALPPPPPTAAAPTTLPPAPPAPNPNRPYQGMTAGQRARAMAQAGPEGIRTPGGTPTTPSPTNPDTGEPWQSRANQVWGQLEGMFLGKDARASDEALGAVKSAAAGQTRAANEAVYSDAARRGIFRSGVTGREIAENERAGAAAYTRAAAELRGKAFDDRVNALKMAQEWLDGLDRRQTNQAQIALAQAQLDLEKQNAARAAAAAGRGRAEDGRELIFRGADGQNYTTTVGDYRIAASLGLDPRALAKQVAAPAAGGA